MSTKYLNLIQLISIICIAYLVGLLMNDMLFDISERDIVTRTYYCELMKSFSEPFGAGRILFPAVVCGLCQLLVMWSVSDDDILKFQGWVIAHFVFVGTPLIGVSLSLCDRACSDGTQKWPVRAEVFTIHCLMLLLFACGLWSQSRILLATLVSPH